MAKVLVTPRSLKSADHPALSPLREAGHEIVIPSPGALPDAATLEKALPGCRGWLAGVEPITAGVLSHADELRVIARNGVGIDNVDLEAAQARGIKVANTPGANARGVAELALGLIFAVARNIPHCDASIRAGGWERRQGIEVSGRTLGIVGCGQIGRNLARLAIGVGMRVLGYDLFPDADFSPEGFSYASDRELLEHSDIVSLHVPGGGEPFLDASRLAGIKRGALVVNTARASAVDENALLTALDDGRLFGYGVDAFEAEPPGVTRLTSHPKVVCTSHIGGFTAESVHRAATQACTLIVDEL